MMSVRRAVGYGAGVLALVVLIACGAVDSVLVSDRARTTRPAPPTENPSEVFVQRLATFAARLKASQPYRDPTRDEQRRGVDALDQLLPGEGHDLAAATEAFDGLGFDHTVEIAPATGRRYAMFTARAGDRRAWGVVLVDLSAPTRLVIEVPHPNSDLKTELMGARLFQATPGAALLMAGAHRRAADGAADVAHNDKSMFGVLAVALAQKGLPQVQLHGFADESLVGEDAVVSSGDTAPSESARRVAGQLSDRGLAVCRPWQEPCGQLEGTLNVQARQAGSVGSVFIHLELNNRVRSDDSLRDATVDAIAAARVDNG